MELFNMENPVWIKKMVNPKIWQIQKIQNKIFSLNNMKLALNFEMMTYLNINKLVALTLIN